MSHYNEASLADLKHCELFEGLSERELKSIASDMREVQQLAGRELAIRGGQGVGFMVILNGESR